MASKADLSVLLQEIRSDAVHEAMDLSTSLRKCKVLAAEIGNDEFEQWSTWESVGYPTEQPVPHYRLWRLTLTGTFRGPFGRSKTAPVPLEYLPESARNFRDTYECRESIALIEGSLARAEGGIVTISSGDLHRSVGRSLIRGYQCVAVKAEVNAGRLTEALNAVRNHILNVTISLLQHYESFEPRYDHNFDKRPTTEPQQPGLVVYGTQSREEVELEAAWARIRPMSRDN